MPFVHASHACACALTETNKPKLEVLILQRLKLVEDRKQHHRRKLRDKHYNSQKSYPRQDPPVLRKLPNDEVHQLDQSRGKYGADQESFDLIPNPSSKLLVRKLVPM